MKLSELPPEVLQVILNGAFRSYLALELWKTGDRSLMSALVNKGVTDIDLTRDYRTKLSRWPTCLKYFKLERLSFELGYCPENPTEYFRQELQQLHGGLKHLRIFAHNALAAMLPPPGSLTHPAANDEDPLPSKRIKTQNCDQDTAYEPLWDLNHTWPLLEHLEIGTERPGSLLFPVKAIHTARMLTLLPRSLTFLGLRGSRIRPVLELMPPNSLPYPLQNTPCRLKTSTNFPKRSLISPLVCLRTLSCSST